MTCMELLIAKADIAKVNFDRAFFSKLQKDLLRFKFLWRNRYLSHIGTYNCPGA